MQLGTVFLFFVLLVLLLLVRHVVNKKSSVKYLYKRKDYLLTKAERSFYGVLLQAINGNSLVVFPKVRLLDIVYPPFSNLSSLNKIRSKHVDFLICDKNYLSPLIAIELDDSSHAMLSRKERDTFLESALASAGLPLLRFPVKHSYDLAVIREKILTS